MPWTFVRPRDPSALAERPLLDVGTGDGQSLLALTGADGLVVGADREPRVLRAARGSGVRLVVAAEAFALPFAEACFRVVLAADVLHHADDDGVRRVASEARRVLVPGGRLVAWWYADRGRGGPGSPRYPRSLDEVTPLLHACGFTVVERLEIDSEGGETAGTLAR